MNSSGIQKLALLRPDVQNQVVPGVLSTLKVQKNDETAIRIEFLFSYIFSPWVLPFLTALKWTQDDAKCKLLRLS